MSTESRRSGRSGAQTAASTTADSHGASFEPAAPHALPPAGRGAIDDAGTTCPACGAPTRPGDRWCRACGEVFEVKVTARPHTTRQVRADYDAHQAGAACPRCGDVCPWGAVTCSCGGRLQPWPGELQAVPPPYIRRRRGTGGAKGAASTPGPATIKEAT